MAMLLVFSSASRDVSKYVALLFVLISMGRCQIVFHQKYMGLAVSHQRGSPYVHPHANIWVVRTPFL